MERLVRTLNCSMKPILVLEGESRRSEATIEGLHKRWRRAGGKQANKASHPLLPVRVIERSLPLNHVVAPLPLIHKSVGQQ